MAGRDARASLPLSLRLLVFLIRSGDPQPAWLEEMFILTGQYSIRQVTGRRANKGTPMPNEAMIQELQEMITRLEQHVEEQDLQMYRLSQRVEELGKVFEQQRKQLVSLAGKSGGDLPPDEKPPHY